MSFSIGKIVLVLLLVWLAVIILLSGPLFHGNEPDEQLLARLTRAVNELEALKQQNEELHALLTSLKSPAMSESRSKEGSRNGGGGSSKESTNLGSVREPSLDFEETRRKIDKGVQELWYFLRSELKGLNKSVMGNAEVTKTITNMLEDCTDHKRIIQLDLEHLKDLDGMKEWREKEMKELSAIIQNRILHLQNPKDCSKAKKLVCNLNKGCGYGCQLHHVVYCLIVAYGTQRTLVLHSKNWRYARNGWESVFQPLSETCTVDSGTPRESWPGSDKVQVIDLPIVDNVKPKPIYLPLDIPKDLYERLVRLHGNPGAWWIGQFVQYLLRPQKELKDFLHDSEKKLNFKKPIVGIHVRRTDKIGTEASFHALSEYMEFVEEYYKKLELGLKKSVDAKRVYLATDDPNVLDEARKKYPDYVFIGDPNIAKSASVSNRYSSSSLKGVIFDIQMLAQCDYLVCTFSSQVCRVAYEIMQTTHPDASSWYQSLDDVFYFGGQKDHNQIAAYNHQPRRSNEIEMKEGDIIGIAGNHWDGYSKGVNRRTHKSGLYPSYKVIEKIDAINFPAYQEADKDRKESNN